MEIYLLLIALAIFSYVLVRPKQSLNNKFVYIFLVMLAFFIVSGFRAFSVGIDTEQFVRAFNMIRAGSDTRYELGFVYLCKIIGFFTNDAGWLLIITSALSSVCVGYLIYKESSNTLLSVLLYLFLNFYFLSMNMMRQWIAICIVLFGYELFLTKDKNKSFIVTCAIAFFFHKTALCGLLLLGIKKIKKYNYSDLTLLYIVITSAVLFFSSSKLLPFLLKITGYESYLASKFVQGSDFAGILLYCVALCLTIATYYYGHVKEGENKEYFLIMCLTVLIFSVGIKISMIERTANYFYIFTIFKFPDVLSSIKIKTNQIIIKYFVTFLFFVYWIIICLYRPEWYGAIPYIWR